jgi:hypothetical protein
MTSNVGPAVEPVSGEGSGPWTSHGWPVDGVTTGTGAPPQQKCGGPAECELCAHEAASLQRRYLEDDAR